MTSEEQRKEEEDAMSREHRAFDRRQAAWSNVIRQLLPRGNGLPTPESMEEFDAAQIELHAAQAEVERIANEIRTGTRR
jgi:hypothetical protein